MVTSITAVFQHYKLTRYLFLVLTIISVSQYSFAQISGNGALDIDGNQYETVIIGNQEWMAENLKTTRYSNGDLIEHSTDDSYWAYTPVGMWRYYNDSIEHELTYGKWYNWYSVIDTRNICPTGWHVPYNNEWDSLAFFLGGAQIAGGKMKEAGFVHWNNPNVGGTNSSGFTALPAGGINGSNFVNSLNMNNGAEFWSSSIFDQNSGVKRYLNSYNTNLGGGPAGKNNGLSVRCLKNENAADLNKLNPNQKKTVIKMTDVMGVETEYCSGKIILILFSDGTVQKIFKTDD
jgi:uncharacterized protein (TIGR02145 family)